MKDLIAPKVSIMKTLKPKSFKVKIVKQISQGGLIFMKKI